MSDLAVTSVPRALVRRLWYGVAGAALFVALATVEGAMRPDYDAWHQAISALSLGSRGWVQAINFVVFGVIVLTTVPAWRRILAGGIGARSYPMLTAVVGLSFLVVAFLPQDPAPGYDPAELGLQKPTVVGLLHLGVAGVAAACSAAALFVMAARFADDHHWQRWTKYTRVMAFVMIACVAIYAVWSTRAGGFAGTFERLAVIIPAAWGFTFVRRLSAGVPFMVDLREQRNR